MTPAVFTSDAIAWIDAITAVTLHLLAQIIPVAGGVLGVIAFLGKKSGDVDHAKNAAAIADIQKKIS